MDDAVHTNVVDAELVDEGARTSDPTGGESVRWYEEAWLWLDASQCETCGLDARRAGSASLVQPEASGGVVIAVRRELYVPDRRDTDHGCRAGGV